LGHVQFQGSYCKHRRSIRNPSRQSATSSLTAHSLDHHQYADDTQLYTAVRPSADVTFTAVSECVEDVARWFLENGLLLNPAKTEAVLLGTKVQRDKIPSASGTDITGTVVPFRDSVKLFGVTLDSVLIIHPFHPWTDTSRNS